MIGLLSILYHGGGSGVVIEPPPPDPEPNINPAAPTGGVVDNGADTFSFTLSSGYALADHEQTTNGGSSWVAATNPVSVGNTNKEINQVGVRVKAATGRNASAILWNSEAFTAVVVDPELSTALHQSTFTTADKNLSDYTPETGNVFVNRIGTARIVGNAVTAGASDNYSGVLVDVGDVDFTIKMNIGSVGSPVVMQIPLRYIDANNQVLCSLAYGEFSVTRTIKGAYAAIGGNTPVSVANSLIELSVQGSTLTFKKNGVVVRTETIPAHINGTKTGFDVWPSTQILDYEVVSIPPTAWSLPLDHAAFFDNAYYQRIGEGRELTFLHAAEKVAVSDGSDTLGTGLLLKTGTMPTAGYVSGKYRIASSGTASHFFPLSGVNYTGVYKVVSIDLSSFTSAGSRNVLGGMIYKDSNNFTGFGFNFATNAGRGYKKIAGTLTEEVLPTYEPYSGTPAKLHMAIGHSNLQLWIENVDGAYFFAGLWGKGYDYTLVSEQALNLKVGVFVDADASVQYNFNSITYGTFGTNGHANPRIVTYEDGSPYFASADEVYFIINGVMGGGPTVHDTRSWLDSCNQIYKFNFRTGEYVRTAVYNFIRPSLPITGGPLRHTSDGVSKVVYDRGQSKFITIAQNMSDDGRDTFICSTTDNILTGVHTLTMESMLPRDTFVSTQYDPDMVKIGSVWHITNSRAPNNEGKLYPTGRQTLFTSTDLQSFTMVWTDSISEISHEGPTIGYAGGRWLSIAPHVGGPTMRVLDLLTGAFISESPHPMPATEGATGHVGWFHVSENGKTFYYIITHDGSAATGYRFGFNDFGILKMYKLKGYLTSEETF